VWEWVLDWFADNWYTTMQAGCADCVNLGTNEWRGARGGYWGSSPVFLRAAYRNAYEPTTRGSYLGFRCARDVP
jgi:formylglycine-generating enzyme required for sulfatase activity